jgi:hypothetical protein
MRLGALGIAMLVVACAAGSALGASPAQTKTTKSYVFKLEVGKAEQMWTPAQVRAKHPKTGEVMVSGSMGTAMSMGGSSRHVEVAVAKRSNGKVVTGVHPTITVVDLTAKNAMPVKVPFAAMRGVDEGADDIHYGNNVDLVSGHRYQVTVALNGEKAVFQVKAP